LEDKSPSQSQVFCRLHQVFFQNGPVFGSIHLPISSAPRSIETHRDPDLREAMRKVKVIDGRNVDGSGEPPLPYYAIRWGLLYWVVQRKGENQELLMVPRPFTLHLSHLADALIQSDLQIGAFSSLGDLITDTTYHQYVH
jgi:hypothetical protein